MKRKLLTASLILIILVGVIPFTAAAEIPPPAALGAPEHFGVSHYSGDFVYYTFSAPEDMRDFMERRAADDPHNKQSFTVHFQIDYQIDGGSWHHTPEWDSPKTVPDRIGSYDFTFANGKYYFDSDRWNMTGLFPEDEDLKRFSEEGWDYLKSHAITFRARFAESFDYGETYVLSPWSKAYTLSASERADYDKLINHPPTLLSAEVKTAGNEPYLSIQTDRIPGEVQDLNAMAGNAMGIEVWVRMAGDPDFRRLEGQEWLMEVISLSPNDFSAGYMEIFEDAGYEIKARYVLNLREYKQSGYFETATSSVYIYSPFSNVISHNMPAWGKASDWAAGELKKADDAGLIPDSLRGADLTKPITREEFCELGLLLYEKATGKSPSPLSPNPFTDTANPQILKAFALGITQGTSATTFSPELLINREQCATMLFRTIKAIHPAGDYTVTGVADFPDQREISSFAVEGTKFMSKLNIIKGDKDGSFMPKATTTAQQAAGYGMATKEAAILMSLRTYEQMDEIKTTSGNQKPTGTTASILGTWTLGTLSGATFNTLSGKYEGSASGLGQQYTFKPDGTYTVLVIWSNAIYMTGRYDIKDGVLTLTDRTSEESHDDGKTWGPKEALPDASAHFTAGRDDSGKYLLLGEENGAPPLVDRENALKYRFKE